MNETRFHGMEEVVGSSPTRSTTPPSQTKDLFSREQVRSKSRNGEDSASLSPIESGADAVTVRLSRGMVALIDAEDEERVCAIKWSVRWSGWRWYAVSNRGGHSLYLHRFILGVPDGVQVDHVNQNGLDCRKANLRPCTNGQNGANRQKKAASASSKFKGVDFHCGSWRARIRKDKVQRLLGNFGSEQEAARAYDAAAVELHGEFARLNFPQVGSA
jgi:HNH endonuclease/AP2 domain